MGTITIVIKSASNHVQIMAKKVPNQSTLNIESTVEEILTTGCLSHEKHFQLMGLFLSDFEVRDMSIGKALRDRQRQDINRIFDLLQTGKLKLVDTD